MKPDEILGELSDRHRQSFDAERRILSFSDWLELFLEAPYRLGRSASQYVADAYEHYGVRSADESGAAATRYLLFDQAFRGGEGRVHAQEAVQERVHRLLRNAADSGRSEKLVLLHGPNGSGKSVIVEAMFRGLEDYSRRPEGALYRFAWVFPRRTSEESSLGFNASGTRELPDSYALLTGEEISARLTCELKDHPFFLVPEEERPRILEEALERRPADRSRSFRHILAGGLCQKCRGIYEGLLAGYQGDFGQVLRHVQVERCFVSQRYRQGAVTIHPVGSVDAFEQQVTGDFSAQNLPPVLQNVKLFEPFGDLVAANGGAVEFGDFLKRPPDLNKYLLGAIEKGVVSLPNSTVHLNLVMLATTNDIHLDAFKATPEWGAFKGRIELVPVPYILEYRKEAELYRDMLSPVLRDTHVAPHAFETAALWAVLTRLLPPDPRDLGGDLGEIARSLTPVEKAFLYDRAAVPERLDHAERGELAAGARAVRRQHEGRLVYEGRFGASPRELRMVLMQAAYDADGGCLTAPRILRRLEELVRDRSVYDFLNIEPRNGYHDAEAFLGAVAETYTGLVRTDIEEAMELIREEEYDRRFDEYLAHVLAFVRGERVRNPRSGEAEPPSQKIMSAIEEVLLAKGPAEEFRKDLVARIGAFALDHPRERVNFRTLFPEHLRAVKRDFYARRQAEVRAHIDALVAVSSADTSTLAAAEAARARATLDGLARRFGYCDRCARDAAAWLRRNWPPESA